MTTIEWRKGKRGRYAYLSRIENGRQIRTSLGPISEVQAAEALRRYDLDRRKHRKTPDSELMAKCRWYLPELFASCRKNAKKRGIAFTITPEDLIAVLEAVGPFCALTGIRFNWDPFPGARKRPWVPSIDRIRSDSGYERGNIRLVCAMANIAMNQWGELALSKLATAMVQYYGTEEEKR